MYHSRDITFEMNEITASQTIKVKPWSGNFVKFPIICKLGNWKIFKSQYFENISIPNTIFNVKNDCLSILILNLRAKEFELKCGPMIGVLTDVY